MRHLRLLFVVAVALLAIASPVSAQTPMLASTDVVPANELAAIRAATEKYRDVKVAIADGYVLAKDMCVTSAEIGQPRQVGAMGLHYARPDLLGITTRAPRVDGVGTHTDFLRPGLLIYEPKPDGSQELVAIESLVWVKAWHEAGNVAAPSFNGNDYYLMHDNPETAIDEAHGFEPHYDLHMWLYKDNPKGMFEPFNPTVVCDHHKGMQAGH